MCYSLHIATNPKGMQMNEASKSAARSYTPNPVYAARGARCKAEAAWRAVCANPHATKEQNIAAWKALQQAKANFRAACKQARLAATGSEA